MIAAGPASPVVEHQDVSCAGESLGDPVRVVLGEELLIGLRAGAIGQDTVIRHGQRCSSACRVISDIFDYGKGFATHLQFCRVERQGHQCPVTDKNDAARVVVCHAGIGIDDQFAPFAAQ